MPSACTLSTFEDEILREYLSNGNIEAIIAELLLRQSRYNLVAWKDPKLYKKRGRELIKLLSNDWVFIIVFRDPYAITMRNVLSMNYDMDRSLLLAAKNNWKLADFYMTIKDKHTCYLVSYEKLMVNTEATIVEILKFLGVPHANDKAQQLSLALFQAKERYLSDARFKIE